MSNLPDLYVLANVDADGNITRYPKGGGSSTPPRIKTYESLASARRGRRHCGRQDGVISIIKVTNAEVVE